MSKKARTDVLGSRLMPGYHSPSARSPESGPCGEPGLPPGTRTPDRRRGKRVGRRRKGEGRCPGPPARCAGIGRAGEHAPQRSNRVQTQAPWIATVRSATNLGRSASAPARSGHQPVTTSPVRLRGSSMAHGHASGGCRSSAKRRTQQHIRAAGAGGRGGRRAQLESWPEGRLSTSGRHPEPAP
jgi:hypothetical protein